MNFLLKMALRSGAAAGAKNIRKELEESEKEAMGSTGAIPAHIFRRRFVELVGKAIYRVDPDKLVGWAKGLAAWLEKESGGVNA